MPHGVERTEYLQRMLDKIDRFELLIAGLVGAVVASWWHKDDLADWRAWLIFLITGVACSLYLTSMVSTPWALIRQRFGGGNADTGNLSAVALPQASLAPVSSTRQ